MVEKTTDQKTPEDTQETGSLETEDEMSPQTEMEEQEEDQNDHSVETEKQPQNENTEESLEDRVKMLEEALQQSEAEANKNRTDYLRALADMENLRKRSEREKENTRKFALEKFALDLLGVMDNVQRAMDAMDAGVEVDQKNGSSLQSVIQGVKMIQAEFENNFSKNGIIRIESMNKPFDPNVHQAVQQVKAKDVKPGTVVQEMRAGYLLNDRLLRPAMVAVSH